MDFDEIIILVGATLLAITGMAGNLFMYEGCDTFLSVEEACALGLMTRRARTQRALSVRSTP